MELVRRTELASETEYKQRKIRGFCHLYAGEEAILCGIESESNYEDHCITAYRDHGHQIRKKKFLNFSKSVETLQNQSSLN
jgi:pyruvate dehydrogenase E1 component alpha subunit